MRFLVSNSPHERYFDDINRILAATFLSAIAMTAAIGPRVEIYTKLACQVGLLNDRRIKLLHSIFL